LLFSSGWDFQLNFSTASKLHIFYFFLNHSNRSIDISHGIQIAQNCNNYVVPELSCSIRHVNSIQIAQDNSATTNSFRYITNKTQCVGINFWNKSWFNWNFIILLFLPLMWDLYFYEFILVQNSKFKISIRAKSNIF
jgi:hypothetical protein